MTSRKSQSTKKAGLAAGVNEPQVARTSIAGRLKMARQMAGLSQGQAARLMGMHRPSVSEMEAGRRRVTAEELVGFAKLYGVTTEWLGAAHSTVVSVDDSRIELAARELTKLQPKDLERVMQLLTALRAPGERAP